MLVEMDYTLLLFSQAQERKALFKLYERKIHSPTYILNTTNIYKKALTTYINIKLIEFGDSIVFETFFGEKISDELALVLVEYSTNYLISI